MLRRPVLFSICFGFGLLGSGGANAADRPAVQPQPAERRFDDAELIIIDRMAADFFEQSLRRVQSQRIEAATAAHYRALNQTDQAIFRAKRRAIWRAFSEEQRQALHSIKSPTYMLLADHQKRQFRQIACDRLTATVSGEIAAAEFTENDI